MADEPAPEPPEPPEPAPKKGGIPPLVKVGAAVGFLWMAVERCANDMHTLIERPTAPTPESAAPPAAPPVAPSSPTPTAPR